MAMDLPIARGVVEGFVAGLHRSPHKGNSVEFKQHRPYVPGDDLRALDWKIYGKTDRVYIREFEEETNLRATLLAAAERSLREHGADQLSLRELAREVGVSHALRAAAEVEEEARERRSARGLTDR